MIGYLVVLLTCAVVFASDVDEYRKLLKKDFYFLDNQDVRIYSMGIIVNDVFQVRELIPRPSRRRLRQQMNETIKWQWPELSLLTSGTGKEWMRENFRTWRLFMKAPSTFIDLYLLTYQDGQDSTWKALSRDRGILRIARIIQKATGQTPYMMHRIHTAKNHLYLREPERDLAVVATIFESGPFFVSTPKPAEVRGEHNHRFGVAALPIVVDSRRDQLYEATPE
jgi:hypothetical protein